MVASDASTVNFLAVEEFEGIGGAIIKQVVDMISALAILRVAELLAWDGGNATPRIDDQCLWLPL